ncbi:TetR/AcrR family transcriptional regulator [Qaidamihabitans albus]|uniref:TetR/AcrR family transcriptional regulator n=1 Tax=Qaidamihabitans albus TaxID=2795733 RepID=UPI0018F14596|nr:TetR family transcriptional regulator [Qaidamihabitans albus]
MRDGATTVAGRDRLLHAAIEHLADNGVTDRSLRGLAAAIGTSHRMLIYHFGSREGLLAEIVDVVERGQRDTLEALADAADVAPRVAVLRFWSLVVGPALRYGPLFFELSAHAMQAQPHAEALRANLVGPWLDALTGLLERAGHDPASARVHARLGLAVARGLLHDVLVTGDVRAADEAMEAFVDLVLGADSRE